MRQVPQTSPEARQRQLSRGLCRLIGSPRAGKTLVLVVEDLHWIDPA